jgi:hypothetical protein
MIGVIDKHLNNINDYSNNGLIEKISSIEQRMQVVGPGLKQALTRLANVDNTVAKIAVAHENKTSMQGTTGNAPEKRRSLFGFGSKN